MLTAVASTGTAVALGVPARAHAAPQSVVRAAEADEFATLRAKWRTLAQAYCRRGTGCTGDAPLRTAILTGLDHLHTEVYHAGQTRYGNWYSWQIGAPQC